jgi:hypothetical protein
MVDLIVFRCPYTGMMDAQTDILKQEMNEGERRYESITCPACATASSTRKTAEP